LDLAILIYEVNVDTSRGWWIHDKDFWAVMLYVLASSITFSFIRIASDKFGRGVLVKMLMGTYKKPREENQIFMFLDLKSSTAIAEQLGHFKYSQFIQDCFYDLNEIVPKYEAEIYQYVGDEVVLTWEYKKGLANNNCVTLFFEFQRLLLSKTDYYMNKYRTLPEFKAGIHGGTLMAAEVGVVKKELAYHGDVINTTARIQALCNRYRQKVIISESLMNSLSLNTNYQQVSLGELSLKGRQQKLNLLGLKEC
jgi:adenylate cyclase